MQQPNTASVDEIQLDDHATLTTRSSLSRYGLPLLRLDVGRDIADLGPTDRIGDELAADYVLRWARQPDRSDVERHAAKQFLRRWPTGPQL